MASLDARRAVRQRWQMLAGRVPLRRLKDETADLHQRAEQYVRILDADATRDDYVRYLRAMWGYHAPLEEIFAVTPALAPIGFEPEVRRRAHLIAADLEALGDAGPWPRCTSLPVTTTLPHLLGVAYVLEGSTLGGRYILAKLPPALAALRAHATVFLTGYGPDTGARWRSFAALADRHLETSDACDAAVSAARDTFGQLVTWLAQHEVPDARRIREAS